MKETYGENIKTVSVLMGHASSAYTLDLYAAYVPNTGIGARCVHRTVRLGREGRERQQD